MTKKQIIEAIRKMNEEISAYESQLFRAYYEAEQNGLKEVAKKFRKAHETIRESTLRSTRAVPAWLDGRHTPTPIAARQSLRNALQCTKAPVMRPSQR